MGIGQRGSLKGLIVIITIIRCSTIELQPVISQLDWRIYSDMCENVYPRGNREDIREFSV